MGGCSSYWLRLLLLLTAIAAVVIIGGCSREAGKGFADLENVEYVKAE